MLGKLKIIVTSGIDAGSFSNIIFGDIGLEIVLDIDYILDISKRWWRYINVYIQ